MDSDTSELKENSVFHLITRKVPLAATHQTLGTIKKEIVRPEKLYDSINYIYVLDQHTKLAGVISVKELLQLPDETRVESVMKRNVITIKPHTHEGKAVHLALKHNIKQVPVLDKDEKFLGVIASDTLLRTANRELEHSLLRHTGISSKEMKEVSVISNSPMRMALKRLPWLVIGLAGGIFAAHIVGIFEALLEKEKILISFLPLMVYMSDAVGTQSEAIVIRYFALASEIKFVKYFIKETGTGLLIALVLATALGIVGSVLYGVYLGIVLSASLFCAVVISVMIAILIPWVLVYLKKDPAMGSGPFATIISDISSIVTYFMVSSLFF